MHRTSLLVFVAALAGACASVPTTTAPTTTTTTTMAPTTATKTTLEGCDVVLGIAAPVPVFDRWAAPLTTTTTPRADFEAAVAAHDPAMLIAGFRDGAPLGVKVRTASTTALTALGLEPGDHVQSLEVSGRLRELTPTTLLPTTTTLAATDTLDLLVLRRMAWRYVRCTRSADAITCRTRGADPEDLCVASTRVKHGGGVAHRIDAITPPCDASAMGLRVHDVVVAIDGAAVAHNDLLGSALGKAIRTNANGNTVTLQVIRDGVEHRCRFSEP